MLQSEITCINIFREWTDEYEDPNRPGVSQNPNILAMQMEQFDVTDADLQPSTSDMSDLSECHPTLGDEYPSKNYRSFWNFMNLSAVGYFIKAQVNWVPYTISLHRTIEANVTGCQF